jgi:hypothetical protein
MKTTLEMQENGTVLVGVDFSDEGISLTGEVAVVGDEDSARAYLPVFEADMRRNFNHLWPLPEPVPMEEEV